MAKFITIIIKFSNRMIPNTPKRILRQSTLPNPDASYQSNNTLKLPVSPKQQLSPQYSPIRNYDNEYSSEQHLNDVSLTN